MEGKLSDQEIEERIEELYPRFKPLLGIIGMTKDQWIEEAIRGERKFIRCENCKRWRCLHILRLESDYPMFIKAWYEYGVSCTDFTPREDAEV